jgi:hypothetical protein
VWSHPQVWKPAVDTIFDALEKLLGTKELASKVTKFDFEMNEKYGNTNKNADLDPAWKKYREYKKAVERTFSA